MTPLPELDHIDRRTFDEEVRPAAKPVILRGLGAGWPAVQAARRSDEAGLAYLKRFSHEQPVGAIVGGPEIEGRFFYTPDMRAMNFTRGTTPLDPFLDRLLRDRTTPAPFAMAVQSVSVPDVLPGFAAENAIDLLPPSIIPRMWLGNAIRVATHYDRMENIGVVMMGRRRFTLFPPEQIANLYMGPLEFTPAGTPVSLVDHQSPDLDRFPRFVTAMEHALVADLEPGDAIYIPYLWWHAVDSLEAVNVFVNYWWDPAPAGKGSPYDVLLHALMAFPSLPEDQRRAYRVLFDHLVFRTNGNPADHLPREVQGVLGEADAAMIARMRATLIESLSHP